jgi:hypothetical protein
VVLNLYRGTGVICRYIKYRLTYEALDLSLDQTLLLNLNFYQKGEDDNARQEFDLGDNCKTAQIIAQSVYELYIGNW